MLRCVPYWKALEELWDTTFPRNIPDVATNYWQYTYFINLFLPFLGGLPEYKPDDDPDANYLVFPPHPDLNTNKSLFKLVQRLAMEFTIWTTYRADFSHIHLYNLVLITHDALKTLNTRWSKLRRPPSQDTKYRDLWEEIYEMAWDLEEDGNFEDKQVITHADWTMEAMQANYEAAMQAVRKPPIASDVQWKLDDTIYAKDDDEEEEDEEDYEDDDEDDDEEMHDADDA